MQSFLHEYVLSVAVAGVIMGLLESLLPEGKLRSAARLALAMVMLLAMVAPLSKLSGVTITLDSAGTVMAQPQAPARQSYEDIVRGVMERQLARDNEGGDQRLP